jgi:SAM-dependent methyltransferase
LEEPRYETIGHQYARFRREDPRIRERIRAGLGDARSVLNVGAGAGSYEPTDLHVVAIEPSDVMAAQRPPALAPAIRATADSIPLRDRSVDAAMAILTIHHWDDARERGVRELRRVARERVVILTYDAEVSGAMWLISDYLPEVGALDRKIFPPPAQVASWLGDSVEIETIPISRDTPDWMLGSYWAHPERVLDASARAATSGFARMSDQVVTRVVHAVDRDLKDGSWEARHGGLRQLAEYDVGLRLIAARLG